MEAEFSLIDVFSDRPFGGNQLAVFPRAEGLSDEVMQQLAREFNFAESTFVLPSSDPACTHRVRIFTPRTELPFAGHSTVGTAAVLASAGWYLNEVSDVSRAVPVLRRILADRVRVLSADHPDTLTSRNDLAGAYRSARSAGLEIR